MDTQQLQAKIVFWQNDLPALVGRFPSHIAEVLEAVTTAAERAGPGKWDAALAKNMVRARMGHLDAVKAVVEAGMLALAKLVGAVQEESAEPVPDNPPSDTPPDELPEDPEDPPVSQESDDDPLEE